MSKKLTPDQFEGLKAWVLVLNRTHTNERRLVAIAALGDIGAGSWIVCQTCADRGVPTIPMHLHDIPKHLMLNPDHRVRVDESRVELDES